MFQTKGALNLIAVGLVQGQGGISTFGHPLSMGTALRAPGADCRHRIHQFSQRIVCKSGMWYCVYQACILR